MNNAVEIIGVLVGVAVVITVGLILFALFIRFIAGPIITFILDL